VQGFLLRGVRAIPVDVVQLPWVLLQIVELADAVRPVHQAKIQRPDARGARDGLRMLVLEGSLGIVDFGRLIPGHGRLEKLPLVSVVPTLAERGALRVTRLAAQGVSEVELAVSFFPA
jgi:hypothetical protein